MSIFISVCNHISVCTDAYMKRHKTKLCFYENVGFNPEILFLWHCCLHKYFKLMHRYAFIAFIPITNKIKVPG